MGPRVEHTRQNCTSSQSLRIRNRSVDSSPRVFRMECLSSLLQGKFRQPDVEMQLGAPAKEYRCKDGYPYLKQETSTLGGPCGQLFPPDGQGHMG